MSSRYTTILKPRDLKVPTGLRVLVNALGASLRPRGPKAGVSNERFSAEVKLIHNGFFSASVYLHWGVGLQCFQGVT